MTYTLPMQKVPITAETPRCTCGGILVPCHNHANGQDFMGCTSYHDLQPYKHVSYPLSLPALGKPQMKQGVRSGLSRRQNYPPKKIDRSLSGGLPGV